jgi:hypothetical protein
MVEPFLLGLLSRGVALCVSVGCKSFLKNIYGWEICKKFLEQKEKALWHYRGRSFFPTFVIEYFLGTIIPRLVRH